MKKKYNSALIKFYIENASGQDAEENDDVADEKSSKKNIDNVPDKKSSKHKAFGKSNCESNY